MDDIPKHKSEVFQVDNQAFWAKIDKRADGHWLWTGKHATNGYGVFQWQGEVMYVHRHAYELVRGKMPLGAQIRITCSEPFCVNPVHLQMFEGYELRCLQLDEEAKERFWSHVDKQEGGCWIWNGTINRVRKYGQFNYQNEGRAMFLHVHRVAYELAKGKIPQGGRITRTCKMRYCVNPDHLVVTVSLRHKIKLLEERQGQAVSEPVPTSDKPEVRLSDHVRDTLKMAKREIERHRTEPGYKIPIEILAMIDNALDTP